jgi:26S proteasome regulatory subunit T1
MTKDNNQTIDTSKAPEKPGDKDKKDGKDEAGAELTASDIKLLKRYGKGPYNDSIYTAETEIKNLNQKITTLCGIKESDTGLALPAQWNLPSD